MISMPTRFIRLMFSIVLPVGVATLHAQQQDTPQVATQPVTTLPTMQPATAPATRAAAPVETALLSSRLTEAETELRTIGSDVTRSAAPPAYADTIDTLPAEIEKRVDESQQSLAGQPAPDTLAETDKSLSRLYAQVSEWNRDLTDRNQWLDQALGRLNVLTGVAETQLAVARSKGVPPEIAARAATLQQDIERLITRATDGREKVIAWSSRVGQQDAKLKQVLADVRAARETAVARLLRRDQPAVWETTGDEGTARQIATDTQDSFRGQFAALRAYAREKAVNFGVHAAITVAIIFGLRAVRRRVTQWMTDEPEMQQAMSVFCHPLATGILLSILFSGWLYPEPPRLFWATIGAAMLIPAMFLLRKLLEPVFYPVLYALVMFYFIDQLRLVTRTQPLLVRRLFLAEMMGAALFLLWFVRSGRLTHVVGTRLGLPAPGQGMEKTAKIGTASPEPQPIEPSKPARVVGTFAPKPPDKRIALVIHLATHAAGIIFTVALIAGVVGFQGLANLIGQATLRSAYVACIFYAAMRVVQGFALAALRTWPLALLRAVQRQRRLIYGRLCSALQWVTLTGWLMLTLDFFSVRSIVIAWVTSVLVTPLSIGSLSVSLSSTSAFVAAIWGSFLVSRFARFMLEQDVYPHLNLNRGLPYAISTTLHYVILLVGFFMALAITGADLTKFAILASAFGLGLGFGLQTIFNNFISGLILLFERPIKLGDVIQLDDAGAVVGTVSRIGIRASVIRTAAGADIIVPNGLLIAGRFANWTLADRRRGLSITVSVAAGTDPAQVVGLLESAATQHPGVDQTPPPKAILTAFGATTLTFELQAWAEGYEEWTRVRSDLSLQIVRDLHNAGIVMT